MGQDRGPQVDLIDDSGILDADRLQDLPAGENRVGALAVDVEGRDVEARLVTGIVRVARADPWGPRLSERPDRAGDDTCKMECSRLMRETWREADWTLHTRKF